ncbi:MAG: hypothetical protein ACOC2V_04690, partial [Alkalispirochaeta sp.]
MANTTIEVGRYEPGKQTKPVVREGAGSIFKPLTSLRMLGEKPDTLNVPKECRAAADRYRGFHVNDL